MKELIEPSKLIPTLYVVAAGTDTPLSSIPFEGNREGFVNNYWVYYDGDGELSISDTNNKVDISDKISDNTLGDHYILEPMTGDSYSGTITITSSTTNSYKAGEWIYPYTFRYNGSGGSN